MSIPTRPQVWELTKFRNVSNYHFVQCVNTNLSKKNKLFNLNFDLFGAQTNFLRRQTKQTHPSFPSTEKKEQKLSLNKVAFYFYVACKKSKKNKTFLSDFEGLIIRPCGLAWKAILQRFNFSMFIDTASQPARRSCWAKINLNAFQHLKTESKKFNQNAKQI